MSPTVQCCEEPAIGTPTRLFLDESIQCSACGKVWLPGADAYHVIFCERCGIWVCYESPVCQADVIIHAYHQ